MLHVFGAAILAIREFSLLWYNLIMSLAPYLDRIFDPIQHVLNDDAARRILDWPADEETQQRLDELADKFTEGVSTIGTQPPV